MYKILVVDDSEFQRSTIKGEFNSDDYQIVEGADGVEGLEACKKNDDIDLIICDLNMPNMNGLEMVGEIRKLENFKECPVLMLTTDSSTKAKTEGKEKGVTGWIIKPLPPGKIGPVVGKLISKYRGA